MGWTLSSRPPKEPELLNAFFMAVGKALHIANAFEAKCQYVWRIGVLSKRAKDVGADDDFWDFAQALKNRRLGVTLNEMKELANLSLAQVEVLLLAKEARNFIAHEGADIGYVYSASERHVREQLQRLKEQVRLLVAGDNLISRWVYEIEEKEPAPRGIQQEYPGWVEKWIFDDINGLTESSISG